MKFSIFRRIDGRFSVVAECDGNSRIAATFDTEALATACIARWRRNKVWIQVSKD